MGRGFVNGSGYADPTAYAAIRNIQTEINKKKRMEKYEQARKQTNKEITKNNR